ncbi:hypothetical protein ACFQ60_01595 [Streptomyces zhihengii]
MATTRRATTRIAEPLISVAGPGQDAGQWGNQAAQRSANRTARTRPGLRPFDLEACTGEHSPAVSR